ncbi:alpha/beta hydrolase [Ligilactobacillus equi]|uniref:alpha/beta hydrolase n=1 Tax=Ligilactobacillus equi TaxID=137357 RepID=UPI0004680C91
MVKNKWWRYLLGALVIILLGGLAYGSNYLVDFAFTRKDPTPSIAKKERVLVRDQAWLKKVRKQTWTQMAANSDLKLKATYVPATKKTNKTIVVAHGYHENHGRMASYIRMFHNLGYNVLAPDDRGAGQSQGKYTTFGWLDRLDYVKWIQLVVKKTGQDAQIGLFGVSMGGATVMMTSGERLPRQVKAIIEDCGYDSVENELTYQLKNLFALPKQPLITTASWVARFKVGFDFLHASAAEQLKHNHLPIFFIHGDQDKYVPTKMVYQNYRASQGPKQLWITKKTAHAMSYYNYPHVYRTKTAAFFAKYLN